MARAHPYSELRTCAEEQETEDETSAEEQETEDELRKLMQPSQLLDIAAFSGEPQVQLIPSHALMSLVLFLFSPVAFPLIMVLIKLDWIKEPPGTQGKGILTNVIVFLRMYHALVGSGVPMIQTINAVIFMLCGRHAPASAVFCPLAMTLFWKCENIALAACAPKNLQGFLQLKAPRMIHLLVRQHESLQVQLREKLPDVITSPAELEHVDNLEEVQFIQCGCCPYRARTHLGDVYAGLLLDMNSSKPCHLTKDRILMLAHSAWPIFSPFWMQQLRVRSLKSCAISAEGLSFDSARFLNSYARACESGSIPAEELADQILLGFPLPSSFAQILLMCALRISLILSLCLILLAFWYSKLVFAKFAGDGEADGKAYIKVNTIHFVVFVLWGIGDGFGCFLSSIRTTTSSLMQRLSQMRALNKMLSGASGSAWCGLPHIQVDKPEHLLMWMEIRALCLASDRPQQLLREVNVAVTTTLSTGMAMVSLLWVSTGSLQNHEKPGLLYFQSLLTVLLYVINLPHVLLAGILANLEHHQSINLLSQHMLQAQFALLHGPNTNFTDQERAKIRETLEVSRTLSQQLAMDSTQIVSIFGVPLTTASASALASLFSSVIIFAIHNDAVQHLLGQVNGGFNWAEVVEEFGNFSNFTSFTF